MPDSRQPEFGNFDLVDPAEVWRAIDRIEASMRNVFSTNRPPCVEASVSEDDLELLKRALRQTVGRA